MTDSTDQFDGFTFRDRYKGYADMKKRVLKASFTVEAAIVMPIVFITIATLIRADIRLHDMAVGSLAANEAAEIYEKMTEDMDAEYVEEYENERLGSLFSGNGYSLDLEENGEGSSVTVFVGDTELKYTGNAYRPEKLMRKLTIIEEVADDQ